MRRLSKIAPGSATGAKARPGRLVLLSVVCAGMLAGRDAGAEGADTIDRALLKEMPRVVGYLKEHGYKNVGVLKFRVKKGDLGASDHVGPLNLSLAGRLEVALVLADHRGSPMGIIRDADAVAATLEGANHLTRAGRQALFRGRYPLAWGDEQVEPDAFLTGVAVVSPDRKLMTVTLLGFDRGGETLDKVAQLTASTDAPTLSEAGESFLIRGAFDSGRTEMAREKAVASAVQVKASPASTPLRDPSAPVALEIRYDGKVVPLEIRNGQAEVREPGKGQAVTFVIRKVDKTTDTYGVVLLVNDVNTMFKERGTPLHGAKWILGPGHLETVIGGYQTGAKTAEAFRVLASDESKANAVHYGPAAGTITLVVFREKKGDAAPPPLEDEAEDMAAVSRGVLPQERPKTLAALKFRLREGGGRDSSRGLIAEGSQVAAKVRLVTFRPDPSPVMSVTITYYKP